MRKFFAVFLVLLILLALGVAGVYGDPDASPGSDTAPAETTAVPEVPTEEPTKTEAPTEEAVRSGLEPAETETEPVTEAPTEPVTEEPTEELTEAPTEAVTEAPEEPVETTEPTEDPEETVEIPTGSLTISRSGSDRAAWYLVEQMDVEGRYSVLVQVALLPGETSVTVAGLPLETKYRVTAQSAAGTKAASGAVRECELSEEAPDAGVKLADSAAETDWISDSASRTIRKGG